MATTSASVVRAEGWVWRAFRNRRQIGGRLGCAPTPYASGASAREQGIRRAGHARLQAISIQLAWNGVRWPPQSALTPWDQANVGKGKRARRMGIVAVARKRVIALWRDGTTGAVPPGAIRKGAYARGLSGCVSRARRVRVVSGRMATATKKVPPHVCPD